MNAISKTYFTHRGLTLLELLISLAIVSILLTAVAPNVQSILTSNRITSDINALSSLMRFARHTAVNEQTDVAVCATTDFSTCNSDWDKGKIVFIDVNSNGQRDSDEALLASGDPLASANTLTGITSTLVFEPDGSVKDNNLHTLKICPDSGGAKYARALIITAFGRISISADDNGDDIAEDAAGNPLTC